MSYRLASWVSEVSEEKYHSLFSRVSRFSRLSVSLVSNGNQIYILLKAKPLAIFI